MIDLAIIGGGPAGYVAAERAAARGLDVTLFEKKDLGGVCLNEGCIPTKTLLYSAKVYDYAKHGDKYGVYAPDVTFDFGKIIARKNKTVRKLVAGINATMKAHNIQVVKGEAHIKGRTEEAIEIHCNDETFQAKNLLLCTGSEASGDERATLLARHHRRRCDRHGVCKLVQQPRFRGYGYRDATRDTGRIRQRDQCDVA